MNSCSVVLHHSRAPQNLWSNFQGVQREDRETRSMNSLDTTQCGMYVNIFITLLLLPFLESINHNEKGSINYPECIPQTQLNNGHIKQPCRVLCMLGLYLSPQSISHGDSRTAACVLHPPPRHHKSIHYTVWINGQESHCIVNSSTITLDEK